MIWQGLAGKRQKSDYIREGLPDGNTSVPMFDWAIIIIYYLSLHQAIFLQGVWQQNVVLTLSVSGFMLKMKKRMESLLVTSLQYEARRGEDWQWTQREGEFCLLMPLEMHYFDWPWIWEFRGEFSLLSVRKGFAEQAIAGGPGESVLLMCFQVLLSSSGLHLPPDLGHVACKLIVAA